MSLRFFADHCVPMEVPRQLRAAGHQVILLRDAMPKRSPDALVLAKAAELKSVLISINGDFSDIVTYPPADYAGIIRSRPVIFAMSVKSPPVANPFRF
jgi:hypothetical protein